MDLSYYILLSSLQNKKLLKSTQRLVAFAILHQTYASQPPSSNPFVSLLINVTLLLVCLFYFRKLTCLFYSILQIGSYLISKQLIYIYLFCVLFFLPCSQAACDDEAEKYERAFVLQLLTSAGSGNSKEVIFFGITRYICYIMWFLLVSYVLHNWLLLLYSMHSCYDFYTLPCDWFHTLWIFFIYRCHKKCFFFRADSEAVCCRLHPKFWSFFTCEYIYIYIYIHIYTYQKKNIHIYESM